MLETYEILELERRWRAYDKKRKEFKFSKEKKAYAYAIAAVLALSVSVSSLTFYLLKDTLINNATNTAISNETQSERKDTKKHSENTESNKKIDPSNNTLLNSDNFGGNENAYDIPSSSMANENITDDQDTKTEQHGWVSADEAKESMPASIGGKQVLVKAPAEETINFEPDNKSFAAQNSISRSQNPNRFQLQSSGSEISVEDLKAKFEKSNSSDIAVLIAKRYYDVKDYQNSEKWALIANELDSNNEESWIIFAKSKYNLKQKNDAISVLRIYNDKANSANIEELMRQIENNTAL